MSCSCVTLKFPRVPSRVSEALVLRTYPLKEADLVVSFFTRDQGKLRGVAKRARRPKGGFGAGLERLSHVRLRYFQRETRELVNLDSVELIQSQFALASDYLSSVALDYFAEISEQMLPSDEPSERFFRLLLAVLESLREGGEGSVLRAVNYFSLWAVRLSGWLPELYACLACGGALDEPGERAFFSRGQPGLTCLHCRRTVGGSEQLGIERRVARPWRRRCCAGRWRGFDRRRRRGFTTIFGAADRSACGTEADHGAHVGNLMPSFQEIIFNLKRYWADRGCIIQEPYDVEVGAGTMCPETFLRVLGPKPYRVAYVQPSRRPADGRYGDNPNRLYKHSQLQVILKPSPDDIIEQYLGSLEAIGIDLRAHDIKFEEDNWEAPTLGAWGIGWQVMLDGLEITQFTYFQQVRRHRSRPGARRDHLRAGAADAPSCRSATASTTSSGPRISPTATSATWTSCSTPSTTSRWPTSRPYGSCSTCTRARPRACSSCTIRSRPRSSASPCFPPTTTC